MQTLDRRVPQDLRGKDKDWLAWPCAINANPGLLPKHIGSRIAEAAWDCSLKTSLAEAVNVAEPLGLSSLSCIPNAGSHNPNRSRRLQDRLDEVLLDICRHSSFVEQGLVCMGPD